MYQPFDIGSRFRIQPPEAPAAPGDRLALIMARGAFGSGEHETTASCLEFLGNMPDLEGARVLDVGSGTGILSIAALRLGAARAVAVDISPDAVACARRNADLNGVGDAVRHVTGSLEDVDETGFDLVLANIYGDLLLEFAPGLFARTRPGGRLLLSGILWEYNFEVRQTFEKLGCRLVKNRLLDEFSSILLEKPA